MKNLPRFKFVFFLAQFLLAPFAVAQDNDVSYNYDNGAAVETQDTSTQNQSATPDSDSITSDPSAEPSAKPKVAVPNESNLNADPNYSPEVDEEEVNAAQMVSVYQRNRPDYSPEGARIRSFRFLPYISTAETYDDNIFATKDNRVSDFYTLVKPGVVLRSDWSRHELSFSAIGDLVRYSQNTGENFDNYTLFGGGRIDITGKSYLSMNATHQVLHEGRGEPNDQGSLEPTKYAVDQLASEFYYSASDVFISVRGDLQTYDYEDSISRVGTVIDNDTRDRTEYTGAVRVGYNYLPGYAAFVETAYNTRQYDNNAPTENRDSHGYKISAGTALDISGTLKGEVKVGYLEQMYDNPNFDSTNGIYVGSNLLWNVTPITSVLLNVNRDVNETVLANVSGYTETTVKVTVEHELLRNLLLNAVTTYSTNEYKDINQTDTLIALGLGGKLFINRRVSMNLDYNFLMRESDSASREFMKNRVLIGLTLAL
ncbi:MAG: hypothetical protein EB060_09100 [Proteobacteria bacterium]|nr:hypothetical protein [Pseudomonadota bacterium]